MNISDDSSGRFVAKRWVPAILAYTSSSIIMTLTNKMVLSGYKFQLPFLILAVQAISSVILLELFTIVGLTKHRPLSKSDCRNWFPVSVLMAAMLYTGSKAIQFLPVPILTIFKNMSIILIAYGESKVFGGKVTMLMLISFGLMILSSMVAAKGDYDSHDGAIGGGSMAGYWWMLTNVVSSASFVIFMRWTLKRSAITPPFKDFDTVFYNNLLTAPMFLALYWMGIDGNSAEFWEYYGADENATERGQFVMAVLFSGITAFWISYASSWCMRVTNSTTYSMVGALNKLPIAIGSLFVFNDTAVTITNISSIFLGFISGMVYTYAKITADRKVARSPLPTMLDNARKD